ncbi:MAG: biotin synthase BioB [Acidobacteriota bacterium]
MSIGAKEALELLKAEGREFFELMHTANTKRIENKGNEISLCGIVNAKSGLCGEDCSFCAQSVHHDTDVKTYPLLGETEILRAAREAQDNGVREFSIVTSGKGIRRKKEIESLKKTISEIAKKLKLERCSSLGIVRRETLLALKEAGLQSYHHNLETARSFFPKICTTRSYDENIKVVINAKELGLKVCCGGIFGMGESDEQIVEFVQTLNELDIDSIPINFLNPIPKTPLANTNFLNPERCLKIIAVIRILFPKKDIFVCGGREVNLRQLQPLIFLAGANGMITGNYLTTKGRGYLADMEMINDMGLKVKGYERT